MTIWILTSNYELVYLCKAIRLAPYIHYTNTHNMPIAQSGVDVIYYVVKE